MDLGNPTIDSYLKQICYDQLLKATVRFFASVAENQNVKPNNLLGFSSLDQLVADILERFVR